MIDYTTIFEITGAFARVHNQLDQFANDDLTLASGSDSFRSLDNLASRFVELLNDSPDERRILGVVERLRSIAVIVDGSWDNVRQVFDEFITVNITEELGTGGNISDVLAALSRAMFVDNESVQQNAVAASAITADASNSGSGKAYVSLLAANPDDTTHLSQLVRNEAIAVTCELDSPNDGVTVGNERWRARSTEGLNAVTTTILVTAGLTEDARNFVIDGSFTVFNAGAFDHFDATGAAIFSQSTTGFLFDAAALRINGSGAATLSQILSDRAEPPAGGVLMALGVHRKVTSITAGTVTLRLVADGVPLEGSIVYNSSTPTGVWGHDAVFVYVPRGAFPDELKVEIVTDAGFSGDLLLDGLSVGVAESIGHGISLAIFQGVEPFVRRPIPDRFTFNTTSDEEGVFTVFLRDVYGVELPASGAPTVDDSLAV